MKGPGLLRRWLVEAPETDGVSAALGESAFELADIQGFILRGYRMPMVRHFLLTVGAPAASAQATRAPGERRRIRRPADHHCRGLARGVRARTRRRSVGCAASHARLLPQHRDHVARTGGAGDRGTRPNVIFQVVWCVYRRRAQRGDLVGETGPSSPQNWIGGFGNGHDHVLVTLHAISPEAMKSYSDRLCAWFAEGNAFQEIWRQDGMALMEMQNGQPVPTPKFTLDIPTASV